MSKSNKVFIATSLDGFIADNKGGIGWLDTWPQINEVDTGYHSFMDGIDALVMGRSTYEVVIGFDIDWPYKKPVYVLSNTLQELPTELDGKVFLRKGVLSDVLESIHAEGYHNLYIDGGQLIQSFLAEDLIDELIITTIPVLLGEGIPLFSSLPRRLTFECVKSETFFDTVVQTRFVRSSK